MKQNKKWMLVAIALLTLVALPLVGYKNAADGTGDTHTHSFKWVGDASTNKVTEKCTICGHQNREIPDFVYVKGGTVTGSGSSEVFIAGRTVKLSDFFIGKYEVTQEEYASVMAGQKVEVDGNLYSLDDKPSVYKGNPAEGEVQGRRPVENVSWYDAVWYCNALSEKEGLEKAYNIEVTKVSESESGEDYSITGATVTLDKGANGYRLPTEAEWEYAARGGKPGETAWNYQWSGTNEESSLKAYAWCSGTPYVGEKTHEVGTKAANSLGIHDMSGNVWEWCWDWHDDDPTAGDGGEPPVTNPTGPDAGSSRVGRGGSWVSYVICTPKK